MSLKEQFLLFHNYYGSKKGFSLTKARITEVIYAICSNSLQSWTEATALCMSLYL